MPWLQVTDRETQDEKRVPLDKERFVIGKLDSCDLVLQKVSVSRTHCEIFSSNGNFFIRDLDSRNGTYVEGMRISTPTPLADGARIDLGPIHIVFRAKERKAAEPEPKPQEEAPKAERRPAKTSEAASRRIVPSKLKKKIHERLLVDLDLRHIDISEHSEEELREKTDGVVRNIVATLSAEIPNWVRPEQLIKEVVDEAVGLGPLEDLLADPEIDEIMVNGWDQIYVERKGKIRLTDKCFTDNNQVVHIIRRIIAPLGRRIDESS
ncbi:MAG: FHA domain-containing protein, partial [Candidatus Brocadiia bacterium]